MQSQSRSRYILPKDFTLLITLLGGPATVCHGHTDYYVAARHTQNSSVFSSRIRSNARQHNDDDSISAVPAFAAPVAVLPAIVPPAVTVPVVPRLLSWTKSNTKTVTTKKTTKLTWNLKIELMSTKMERTGASPRSEEANKSRDAAAPYSVAPSLTSMNVHTGNIDDSVSPNHYARAMTDVPESDGSYEATQPNNNLHGTYMSLESAAHYYGTARAWIEYPQMDLWDHQEDIGAAEFWGRTGGLNDTVLDDLTTLQQPDDVPADLYGSVDSSIVEDFGHTGFTSVEQGASTYSADLTSAVHEPLALTELPGFEGL
ncbi:hypothetical protein N0V87_005935 [Didymella glomerata]|uniref:Uncharacterized protein n=1 Tax=Didymella glomerata TaxID=749621 RepID=A0A9W9BZ92_9PLEO|nr:hypothetical protein N0V87_005935 [Didymella glomerata]